MGLSTTLDDYRRPPRDAANCDGLAERSFPFQRIHQPTMNGRPRISSFRMACAIGLKRPASVGARRGHRSGNDRKTWRGVALTRTKWRAWSAKRRFPAGFEGLDTPLHGARPKAPANSRDHARHNYSQMQRFGCVHCPDRQLLFRRERATLRQNMTLGFALAIQACLDLAKISPPERSLKLFG